jgi:hypothetical protein
MLENVENEALDTFYTASTQFHPLIVIGPKITKAETLFRRFGFKVNVTDIKWLNFMLFGRES